MGAWLDGRGHPATHRSVHGTPSTEDRGASRRGPIMMRVRGPARLTPGDENPGDQVSQAGSVKRKTEPWPTGLGSASMVPPWRVTMRRTIERPRPLPSYSR